MTIYILLFAQLNLIIIIHIQFTQNKSSKKKIHLYLCHWISFRPLIVVKNVIWIKQKFSFRDRFTSLIHRYIFTLKEAQTLSVPKVDQQTINTLMENTNVQNQIVKSFWSLLQTSNIRRTMHFSLNSIGKMNESTQHARTHTCQSYTKNGKQKDVHQIINGLLWS